MSEVTQEGIVMMILMVGAIIGWGIWLVRFVRQWEDERNAWRKYQAEMAEVERRRIEARNYRYSRQ